MHETRRVGRTEHVEQHRRDPRRLGRAEGAPDGQVLGQRRSVDELHDEVEPVAVLAGVVGRDRMRVAEAGGRLRLAPEPGRRLGVDTCRGQQLDGHRPVQPQVDAADDLCHAARAERATELVTPGQPSFHPPNAMATRPGAERGRRSRYEDTAWRAATAGAAEMARTLGSWKPRAPCIL